MESKFYFLIFFALFTALAPARTQAQDSTTCTAQFFVSNDGNTVFFRAIDSLAGVQDYWNFGDSTQVGFGNYAAVQHTYSHSGSFAVTHKVINTATGCHDSLVQVITIGAPPPKCGIIFSYSHDSTRKNSPYWFYATPYLAGAATDTVTWSINGRLVGTGDTLHKVLAPATYTVCATLRTSLGCSSQYCATIYASDSTGGTPPPDSIHQTPPPDSIITIPPDSVNPGGPIKWPGDSIGIMPPDSAHPDSVFPIQPDSLVSFLHSYPNPTNNQTWLDIQLDNPQMVYIRVYNSMGSEVEELSVSGYPGNNHLSVSMAGLQKGIYLIQLQYGNTIKRSRIQKL